MIKAEFTCEPMYGYPASMEPHAGPIAASPPAPLQFHFCIVRFQDVGRLFLQRFAVASPDAKGQTKRRHAPTPEIDPGAGPPRRIRAPDSSSCRIYSNSARAPRASVRERRAGRLARVSFFRKRISKFLSPNKPPRPGSPWFSASLGQLRRHGSLRMCEWKRHGILEARRNHRAGYDVTVDGFAALAIPAAGYLTADR
jgi:hypothetical protein